MRFTRSGRTLLYRNQPVNLAGILAGVDPHSTSDSLDPPYADDFQHIVQWQNNFHRHWVTPYWAFSPLEKPEAMRRKNSVFQRKLVDKKGLRWLLFGYNADYFTRLDGMIAKAAQSGVVVQLVLFDRCGLDLTGSGGAETWPPDAVPGYPVRRWDDSPWNVRNNDQSFLQGSDKGDDPKHPRFSAIPEFFAADSALRNAQQKYIEQVVNATKGHWNVFYEIMNEPKGPVRDRVLWADWVVGVIQALTGGSSIIFYNDFNPTDGGDVNLWKTMTDAHNYANFHGVTFHRVPTSIDPKAPDAATKFAFLNEKVFQVSTDGNSAGARDTERSNDGWCGYAFDRGMILQAHTLKPEAAKGIANHHPAVLK